MENKLGKDYILIQPEVETKIVLTHHEFVEAMRLGGTTDISGKSHDFRKEDDNNDYYLIKNVIVEQPIIIEEVDFSVKIILRDCSFASIKLTECSFKQDLAIRNSTINSKLGISSVRFGQNLTIIDSFIEKIELKNISILNNAIIQHCTIDDRLEIEYVNIVRDCNILFTDVNKSLWIALSTFQQQLKIAGCNIKNNMDIFNTNILNNLILNDRLIVNNNLSIAGCTIKDNINITDIRVLGDAGFHLSNDLQSTFKIVEGQMKSISLPVIGKEGSLNIFKTGFQEIRINKFNNLGYMQWNDIVLMGSEEICIEHSIMGKWDLVNCNFIEVKMTFFASKISDAFYTNTQFPKKLVAPIEQERQWQKHEILRDGYNQLKTLARKQNDRKMFLHYQMEELKSYNSTLKWRSEDFSTKFQLCCMSLSNNYGTDWLRAVWWVLGLNLLFISIGFCFRKFDITQIGGFIANYFEYLFAFTTKPKFLDSYWETIWFFFSRVFIVFAIYQTITAFRKFGKGD